MSYTPKYTTINNIAKKLEGRLKITPDVENPIQPITPGLVIDNELIELSLEECEMYVDLILEQVYQLPLANSHPRIRYIVDNLCIADLMGYSYDGSAGFGAISSDSSNFGATSRMKAYEMLATLVVGSDVAMPGNLMPPPGASAGMRRVELPGEKLRVLEPMRIIENNDVVVGENQDYDYYLNDDYHINNPFSDQYCGYYDDRCNRCY